MLKNIFDKLKEDKLNPYFIGQYKGLCREPYVVVKESSQIPSLHSNRLGQKQIDIILYAPERSYIEFNRYAGRVRASLKELGYLRKTGYESPTITDSDKGAYTMSIEYILQKTLEG